jgi:hypothetical protein
MHMRVDKSGRDQFSRSVDAGINGAGIGSTCVDDAIVFIDDCAVVVDLVVRPVERYHPATLN